MSRQSLIRLVSSIRAVSGWPLVSVLSLSGHSPVRVLSLSGHSLVRELSHQGALFVRALSLSGRSLVRELSHQGALFVRALSGQGTLLSGSSLVRVVVPHARALVYQTAVRNGSVPSALSYDQHTQLLQLLLQGFFPRHTTSCL